MIADPAVRDALVAAKARMLARIDDASSQGEPGGSEPLATSLPADIRQAAGIPAGFVALLDAVFAAIGDRGAAMRFLRDAVDALGTCPQPFAGAQGVMVHMLQTPEARAWRDDVAALLVALHRADPGREGWRRVRDTILTAADEADDSQRVAIAALWEAAAWPADAGNSVLVSTFAAWQRLELIADHWSRDHETRAFAMLADIRTTQATTTVGDAGSDYRALFHRRDPALCDGFERNLAWANRRSVERVTELSHRCLAALRGG